MKKVVLELPETKEEFINCLKKIDKDLENQENDTHYLVPSYDIIENVIFMKKEPLIIQLYQSNYVNVIWTVGGNYKRIVNKDTYAHTFIRILEYYNKI